MVPILLNLDFLLESRHMGSDRHCSRQANRKLLRARSSVGGNAVLPTAVHAAIFVSNCQGGQSSRSMCYGACNPIMTTCHPSADGEIENWLWYEPGDDTLSVTAVR